MQLSAIKLIGFKSFADRVHIPFQKSMCAIVGPNGCGKSNVVDAIRWVVGEGSAKQLRMQSMADVIFSGTTQRKPLAMASVEMIFDNSQGRLTGEFAGYDTLSIKRAVERDGQSDYFINNTPCRRKDIIDIFLGTGLGPRSYAVIEQGMISRLIEAKPDELRAYLEEAAGVSKYKERRRETSLRMRHTRENMERLDDIREEQAKQQRHLKRQAGSAEKYKVFKAQERTLHWQCLAIEWRGYQAQCQAADAQLAQLQTALEAALAERTQHQTDLVTSRAAQQDAQQAEQAVQKQYYALGSDIARVEQQISHLQAQRAQLQANIDDADQQLAELTDNLAEQQDQIQDLEQETAQLTPDFETQQSAAAAAKTRRQQAEQALDVSRTQWEQYQQALAALQREHDVLHTKQTHTATQLSQWEQRQMVLTEAPDLQTDALSQELAQATDAEQEAQSNQKEANATLEQWLQKQQDNQQAIRTQSSVVQELAGEQQNVEARLSSLQALQQAAVGQDDQMQQWLSAQAYDQCQRFSSTLSVSDGWQSVVEMVLAADFNRLCVSNLNTCQGQLVAEMPPADVCWQQKVDSPISTDDHDHLGRYVSSDYLDARRLSAIYVAESRDQAWAMREQLQSHESVVTKDGAWMGRDWLRLSPLSSEQDSQLWQMQAIKEAQATLSILGDRLTEEKAALLALQETEQRILSEIKSQRAVQQNALQALNEVSKTVARCQATLAQASAQKEKQQVEQKQCSEQIETLSAALSDYETQVLTLATQLQEKKSQRESRIEEGVRLRDAAATAVTVAETSKQTLDETQMRLAASQDQLRLLTQMTDRASKQIEQLSEKRAQYIERINQDDNPDEDLKSQLQSMLSSRLEVEAALKQAADAVAKTGAQHDRFTELSQLLQKNCDQAQAALQEAKIKRQDSVTRQTTLAEALAEAEKQPAELLADLSDDCNLSDWQAQLAAKQKSIERLGPINMAAIDEYEAVCERKDYLDQQYEDLTEALSVLEGVMGKIDRESKDQLKQTFHTVNENLQQLFPKVFGGGRACLELTEQDWMTAGMVIRAQPPGKRNTTIHMLSGGEKALTAIALVFSVFLLNPAPFCVLDEVDAPLDDSNVTRFSRLVKEMSSKTQFIVISHNKVTISAADQLMGVTMQEAGVSRVVSVDVQSAVEMAEA